jgi:hypothetical protein
VAIKDLRSTLMSSAFSGDEGDDGEDVQIQRLLADVAREMGLMTPEQMGIAEPTDELTVVYDKFLGPRN